MGTSNQIVCFTTLPISKRFRGKLENTNPLSVLDRDIDLFIEEGLKNK